MHYKAHGKLLLTGEYFVLDGALALAIPTRLGQTMTVRQIAGNQPTLQWVSKNHNGNIWFEGQYELPTINILHASDEATAKRLATILKAIQTLKPGFWASPFSYSFETQLEFPQDWGLGSSSTLIAAIAKWAEVDPFVVLGATFGGSGYDLACAFAPGPLLYQRIDGQPNHVYFPYDPPYKNQLYFVHLGKKQNSREGIARYRAMTGKARAEQVKQIDALTSAFLQALDLTTTETIIAEHERVVADALRLQTAKTLHFPNFWGSIKSLGAWGGDFVLATSNRSPNETKAFFNKCGFDVVVEYEQMTGLQDCG